MVSIRLRLLVPVVWPQITKLQLFLMKLRQHATWQMDVYMASLIVSLVRRTPVKSLQRSGVSLL